MNSDVAHQVATRREDRAAFTQPLDGHRYCWRCSTYRPDAVMGFGGSCWDCIHNPARRRGARVAVNMITHGRPGAALIAIALAVDEQARAEGITLPVHQTVIRNAHRRLLGAAMARDDHAARPPRAGTGLGTVARGLMFVSRTVAR